MRLDINYRKKSVAIKNCSQTYSDKNTKLPINFILLLWEDSDEELFQLNSTLFLHKIDDQNSQWHFLREVLLENYKAKQA